MMHAGHCCRRLRAPWRALISGGALVTARSPPPSQPASALVLPLISYADATSSFACPAQCRHIWATPLCMGRKSAKIAHKKNKEDEKRQKIYGKFGKLIVGAVKEGGGVTDPSANPQLAKVLSQARDMSVPKELVDRNLTRAANTKQADFAEITYEAYGHGGVGIVMEVLTDNINRAAADTRSALNKGGGKMASSGSVLFNFERKGVIVLDGGAHLEDLVFEVATEAGADDVTGRDDGEEGFTVTTSVPAFVTSRRALADAGFVVNPGQTALKMIPLITHDVDDVAADANDALVERLLELDDVDAVYTQ
mmetsp:Transcript_19386/g.31387  ORF Transcript_19386/g.31387 Transcript_19386/m.31387 type:complete len:309 (+) Transcript_19386:38-964(+)